MGLPNVALRRHYWPSRLPDDLPILRLVFVSPAMKPLYFFLLIISSVSILSCQQEEEEDFIFYDGPLPTERIYQLVSTQKNATLDLKQLETIGNAPDYDIMERATQALFHPVSGTNQVHTFRSAAWRFPKFSKVAEVYHLRLIIEVNPEGIITNAFIYWEECNYMPCFANLYQLGKAGLLYKNLTSIEDLELQCPFSNNTPYQWGGYLDKSTY